MDTLKTALWAKQFQESDEPQAIVYAAAIPNAECADFSASPLFPPQRQAEIVACASEKAKREKYFVWTLLAYAVQQSFGKDLREFSFHKSENGKWRCDGFEFSLSHSGNAVCVALANTPVGVDIQVLRALKTQDFATKILSETELAVYHTTPETEKNGFLLRAWTKKEAVFKARDEQSFFCAEPKTLTPDVWQTDLCVGGESYSLSVATRDDCSLKNVTLSVIEL